MKRFAITYKIMEQCSNFRVLVTIKKAFATYIWSDAEYIYASLGRMVTIAIPVENLIYIEKVREHKREQIGKA